MIHMEAPNGNAGKKSGRLSHGHKRPPSKRSEGLDWGAIERQFAERLQRDIDNGVDDIMTRAELRRRAGLPPVKKAANKSKPGVNPTRQPRMTEAEVDEVVGMYLRGGKSVPEIAAAKGYATITIREYLKRREVYDPERDRGRGASAGGRAMAGKERPESRKDTCVRGHDRTVPGNVRPESGSCLVCDRERQRR